jgi:hypothetical protein
MLISQLFHNIKKSKIVNRDELLSVPKPSKDTLFWKTKIFKFADNQSDRIFYNFFFI